MVSVDLFRNRQGMITGYKVSGHAGYSEEGSDIVCSAVSALTQGCPYCNTIFQVKDLFPRITNTYFIRDNNKMKRGNIIWYTILVVFLLSVIPCLSDPDTPIPARLFMSYFITLFGL